MNYEGLPVYKVSLDLLVFIYKITSKVERQYRYTLVEELKQSLQEILVQIYTANTIYNKEIAIAKARQELVRARVLITVMKELKLLSVKQIITITEKIASISKQLTAWEKYTLTQREKKT